jgi:FkbM family methyltransferase
MLLHPLEVDNVLSAALLRSRIWEPFETELFKEILEPGMIVADVGANIGYHTLLAAKLVKPNGRVYAFEPSPDNYQLLVKNINLNGYSSYVIPINKAVDSTPGELKLFLSPENRGDHRSFDSKVFDYDPYRQWIAIKSVSLDSFFMKERRIPDVIKMDIQGYEFNAFKGMRLLMAQCENLLLFTEVWPRGLTEAGTSTEDYVDSLIASGFDLYLVAEEVSNLKRVNRAEVLDLAAKCDDSMYLNLLCRKGWTCGKCTSLFGV